MEEFNEFYVEVICIRTRAKFERSNEWMVTSTRKIITWAECRKRNKEKFRKIERKSESKLGMEERLWGYCYSFSRRRLAEANRLDIRWQRALYLILEKMNRQCFKSHSRKEEQMDDFSRFEVQVVCKRTRGKNQHYVGNRKVRQDHTTTLWSECMMRNINKLKKRNVKGREEKDQDEVLWKICITNNSERLKKTNDLYRMWYLTEYRILNKMNDHMFKIPQEPNTLWNEVSRKQITKINHLIASRVNRYNRRGEGEVKDWEIVIRKCCKRLGWHVK